ncbi:MAG: FAD-binding oxidoreductase [Candidatus Korobacteraceae bacterium]
MDIKNEALVEIAGSENVSDDPEILNGYAADCSYAARRTPWFVVRPKTVQEVQALVTWANETETPLIPVSSGAPHFHGDTVPSAPEGVIVDLSRMKDIMRIDRRNKIVIIEPGVTYAELQPALAKEGLRISRPLLPRANKSVIASLLERQPTLIPRFNFSLPEPLRACGVVWGSGEVAFTGEAGNGPMDLEQQWKRGVAQVDPKGPNATDLMRLLTGAQGSMGIVVWASVKCELIPSVRKYVFVPAESIEHLIDFCYKLERIRLGDEVMVVNAAQLATMLGSHAEEIKALKEDLPAWTVIIGLAGTAHFPEERVQVQELELKRLVQQCGMELLGGMPKVSTSRIASAVESCSAEPYFKFTYKGACQDIFFLTTLDKTPQFIETVFSIASRLKYSTSDIGIYIQPQHQGVSQHVEFNLPFDPSDRRESEKVKQVYTEASQALIAQGAYFSRPYGSWAELVYSRDADATRVLRTVKQIVDPKNVLNPGKLCF